MLQLGAGFKRFRRKPIPHPMLRGVVNGPRRFRGWWLTESFGYEPMSVPVVQTRELVTDTSDGP